jgi:hypothetical protein
MLGGMWVSRAQVSAGGSGAKSAERDCNRCRVLVCHQVVKARGGGESCGEVLCDHLAFAEAAKHVAIRGGHVLAFISEPVRRDRHALLNGDEEVQQNDFAASSVLSTIGRAEDAASEQLLDGAEVERLQNRARESRLERGLLSMSRAASGARPAVPMATSTSLRA